jgi:N utilization substance protein B
VNEYVDIARAFFDADIAGMVNAVLDGLARSAAGEFAVGLSDTGG